MVFEISEPVIKRLGYEHLHILLVIVAEQKERLQHQIFGTLVLGSFYDRIIRLRHADSVRSDTERGISLLAP